MENLGDKEGLTAVEIEETPLNPNRHETIQQILTDTQNLTVNFGYMECGLSSPVHSTSSTYDSFEELNTELSVQIRSDTLRSSLINQMKNDEGVRLLENIEQGNIKAENIPQFFETSSKLEKSIAFLWSAFLKMSDLLEGFLSIGAELNFCDQNGFSALHLAAFSGCLPSTRFLISKQMEVNMQPKYYTPLHCAAFGNSVETAKLLLKNGALISIDTKTPSYEQSLLHCAVRANSLDCVKLFIEEGADVNTLKPNGTNAIHLAAYLGNSQCLEALLNAPGADPDIGICTSVKNSTALHLAVDKGYVECVKLLLAKNADSNLKNDQGVAALHLAGIKSRSECVKLLLEKGDANPNVENTEHSTPLHAAIGKSEHALVILETLISYRANVNHQDIYGFTPLHHAAYYGLLRCVEMLISHGADVTIKSHDGTTALNLIIRQTPAAIVMITHKIDAAITLDRFQDIENKDLQLKLNFRELLQHSHPHEISYLNTFVDEGQTEILEHPLCSAFLYIKWGKIQRYYFNSLTFYYCFVAILTAYVLQAVTQNCYNGSKDDNTTIQIEELCQKQSIFADLLRNNSFVMKMQNCYNGSKDDNTTIQVQELCQQQSILVDLLRNNSFVIKIQNCYNGSNDDSTPVQMQRCQQDLIFRFWVMICITIPEIFRKVCGMRGYSSIRHYVTQKENYLQWPVILSVFLLNDINSIQTYKFQYHTGVFAVLLGWINLVLMFGQLPVFAVYVAMYIKMLKEVAKLFLVYSCMLVVFTISFCVIFRSSSSFTNPIMGFVTVLLMMIGEIDLSLLTDNPDGKDSSVLLKISAIITFVLFLLFVPITLMNLLVGIAVHDIPGLKKTAEQSKLVQQTKLIYYMESILFDEKQLTWVNKVLHYIGLKSPQPCQEEHCEEPFNLGKKNLPREIWTAACEVAIKREHSGNTISPRCTQAFNFSDGNRNNNNNSKESVRLSTASICSFTAKIDDSVECVEAFNRELKKLKKVLLIRSRRRRRNYVSHRLPAWYCRIPPYPTWMKLSQ